MSYLPILTMRMTVFVSLNLKNKIESHM